MSQVAVLRASLERSRRAKLHAQISALEAKLEALSGPNQRQAWLTRMKLKNKIERLYREMQQPTFVQMGGR